MKQDFIEPGFIYHVYNRGNNQEDIFKEERNYEYFLSLMKKYLLPIANIYAYCLLRNHFHLVLQIKDAEFVEEKYKSKPHLAFSNLFNAYTKSINKAYNRNGSLFQEHFHRKRVVDEDYLTQLITYVHLNPVKHGFTDNFKSYRHSSYAAYRSGKPTQIKCEYIMSLFGDPANFEYCHDLNKIYFEDQIEDT